MNQQSLEWLPIPQFEGLYEINQQGQIKSLYERSRGKILKPSKDKCGYEKVVLYRNNAKLTRYIHRLMGFTFIPIEIGKPYINHIDGVKNNNNIENLEWVSASENIRHANRLGLTKNRIKAVVNICTGERYKSVKQASEITSIRYTTLKNMLNGNRKNKTCLRLAA